MNNLQKFMVGEVLYSFGAIFFGVSMMILMVAGFGTGAPQILMMLVGGLMFTVSLGMLITAPIVKTIYAFKIMGEKEK